MKNLFTDMGFNLALYCLIAFLTALSSTMGGDEAAKYINPQVLFWVKASLTALSSTALAAKLFLSTSYADYQAKKKAGTLDTAQFVLRDASTTVKTNTGI